MSQRAQKNLRSFQRRNVLALASAFALASGLPAFAAAAKPKIGFVGAGKMGKALGTAVVKAGYQVKFSSRHPEELKEFVSGLGSGASAGTPDDAVAFGDVIVVLVPYGSWPEVAEKYGKQLAKKQLLLDVSNPVMPRDGAAGQEALDKGAGVWLAEKVPGAKIVRAFNAVGYTKVEEFGAKKNVGVPIAGNDKKAIEITVQMAKDIGFEPVVVGDITVAGKLLPRSAGLDGEQTPDQIRAAVAKLK